MKRLQSSLPLDKSRKYDDENFHRPYKSDSSLLSINSNSPTTHSIIHGAIADSTTSTYLDNSIGDHEHDSEIRSTNLSTTYQHQFSSNSFYSNYVSDSSSMIYNPAYTYMGTTSNSIPSTSTPMYFNPYGRYPTSIYQTHNYNGSYFLKKLKQKKKKQIFVVRFVLVLFSFLSCVYIYSIKSNNQSKIIYLIVLQG